MSQFDLFTNLTPVDAGAPHQERSSRYVQERGTAVEESGSWRGRIEYQQEQEHGELVDVVAREFNQTIRRSLTEEQRWRFNEHRTWALQHGVLRGEPTFLLNRPRLGHCSLHQRFEPGILTYEVSRTPDFDRIRYAGLCFEGAKVYPDRYVRKWQPPASVMYKGEENMLYDDFCYWHYRRENRMIQSREFTQDIVKSVEVRPMCDEAHEEIAAKGWYVAIWQI